MKKIFFTSLLFLPLSLIAQLKINEIMSNNVSAVLDDAYNYSMWVEIYNQSTTTSYNQAAYYFTDTKKEPAKWKPQSKLIVPGGYGVLWFERDERTGHSCFKLDPAGGKLYMYNLSAQLVDSVIYPAQYRNVSYGRQSDGGANWAYFEEYSAGASNNGKRYASERCSNPVFATASGFYPSAINVKFATPAAGDTIYYTLTNVEPTKQNGIRYVPGYVVSLTRTASIRAKCISANKLSSNVVTSTYFIGERDFQLPVVSIVTNQANLTDNTIGIYVAGTNGITGNGSNSAVNWNQDWDRPVNFELFDTTNVCRLNQELDISISGGWSRLNAQKSLKISPRNKFGNNRLPYDLFPVNKPNRKYKDIQLRNSGNDFGYSMMRDAFMESLIINRMDIDYLAYEPAVCFMNGVYYGIQNLRERSSKEYIYSNYGYDEDDIHLLESIEISTDTSFTPLSSYISNYDITKPEVYTKVCSMMDVDNFANYMISQIYYGNTDWPDNNIKVWKKKAGGKWRWILFDTDFGYNLYDTNLHNHNTLSMALGEKTDDVLPAWSTLLLRRLVLNDAFRNKFIDRFCVQLSSTFETNRANHILDSMAAKIQNEIVYHKAKWGSSRTLAADVSNMKVFSANRPAKMLGFISSRFVSSAAIQTVKLSANVPGASYKLNNEPIIDSNISLKYFNGRTMALEARPVPGYKFKQWEVSGVSVATTVFAMGSTWKYNDGGAMPAVNWYSPAYADATWKSGAAPLGYASTGVVATIGYGGVATNKYPTAYFRKTINITGLGSKSNFTVTGFVDDGAAVYVNGTEIGRYNMPVGTLAFSTVATTYNNGATFTFSVPQNLLKEGDNVIAVEVHQNAVNSSDMIFDMSLAYTQTGTPTVTTAPVYTTTLTKDMELKAVYEVSTVNPDETPAVYINEVMPANTLIADEAGGFDDYIELYNAGEKAVNVAGWYITDMPVNRMLCQIPCTDSTKTNIPAKGRLVIWADDEAAQGILHVGLKLSKDGETLVLSRKNSLDNVVLVDSVSFPALGSNITYSRVPDGGANWMLRPATFNAANGVVSAIDYTAQSEILVYPTLVKESFTLDNAAGKLIIVTDLTGKTVLRKMCIDDHETIPAGYLQRGMYILSVDGNSFKVIKL
ncbi:MAG: CotH kinase family protein [Paludibacter sp.]